MGHRQGSGPPFIIVVVKITDSGQKSEMLLILFKIHKQSKIILINKIKLMLFQQFALLHKLSRATVILCSCCTAFIKNRVSLTAVNNVHIPIKKRQSTWSQKSTNHIIYGNPYLTLQLETFNNKAILVILSQRLVVPPLMFKKG